MAKRKRSHGKNMPAKTPSAQLASLRQGNPGNCGGGDKTDAFRIRAAQRLEDAKGLDVVARILSGDILEFLGTKDGTPIVGFTANDTRIRAFRELRECAGYGSPAPVRIEAQGDVIVQVVYDE